MKIYIAGPMRGRPYYNFPAFDLAEHTLEDEGHTCINPARLDREERGFDPCDMPEDSDWWAIPEGFDLKGCIRSDVDSVLECDAIWTLDGYEASSGATAEVAVAKWAGKQILGKSEPSKEVRTTSSTGGQKGTKMARFDLLPVQPIWELSELYGAGALKYEDNNYRKGYEWSKSYAAALRHLALFWGGEDYDEETGAKHVINAAWHCLAMADFMNRHPQFDDRYEG